MMAYCSTPVDDHRLEPQKTSLGAGDCIKCREWGVGRRRESGDFASPSSIYGQTRARSPEEMSSASSRRRWRPPKLAAYSYVDNPTDGWNTLSHHTPSEERTGVGAVNVATGHGERDTARFQTHPLGVVSRHTLPQMSACTGLHLSQQLTRLGHFDN